MEFKGTKGKWSYNRHCVFIGEKELVGVNEICRLHIGLSNYMNGEQEYNALLISKAPELLEMLIKCTDILATTTEHDVLEKYQLLVDKSNKLITEATTL